MRSTILSADLFPSEYKSLVNENDPCHKIISVEEIPDPTPFTCVDEEKEIISDADYGFSQNTNEEHECCVSVKTGNCGCVHVVTTNNLDKDETAEVEFQKSPRQKFVDKIKSGIASTLVYSKRASCASKFSPKKEGTVAVFGLEPQPWIPADTKQREKKVSHKEKRSQRIAVAKMKITGPPVQEDFSIEESLPDVE